MARDEGNTGGDNVREMESGWAYISGSQFSEPANLHCCLANLLLLSSEKFLIGAGQFWRTELDRAGKEAARGART